MHLHGGFLQEAVDKKRKDDGIRGPVSGHPKSQRGFPQKKLPWHCAFCTENQLEEKTEKIKKHLPIIISPEKELSTFHNSAAFIYSGVLSGPFTGLVDKYSEKPEKLIVF